MSFLGLLRKTVDFLKEPQELNIIQRSGLFDKHWYLENNPDVIQAKVEPELHYLRYGGFDGRDPSPDFSSSFYLDTYEDVKNAGINPLIHYLKYGRKEGRFILPRPYIAEVAAPVTSFLFDYITEISSSLSNSYAEDNYDFYRFGPKAKGRSEISLKTIVQNILRKNKYVNLSSLNNELLKAFRLIENILPRIENVFHKLADNASRLIIIKVLAYRALGYEKVKLPLSTPNYWEGIKSVEKLADLANSILFAVGDFKFVLSLFDLTTIGLPINLYATPLGVFTEFVLGQYKCNSDNVKIGAEQGDVVIDAGACWGDTSLDFAHCVGPHGKVFSFEFVPRNLEIFSKNLSLNPQLSDRIILVNNAVWNQSYLKFSFGDTGPGTSLNFDNTYDNTVETLSIDDLVNVKKLSRVDFIKMDIEGAELKALHGAINTIKRDKPKLAICIYHKLIDFVEIPEFILSLDLGYEIYIRHFTIYDEETILFAKTSA